MRSLKKSKPYFLVLPSLMFFLIFVIYGIIKVFSESLNSSVSSGSWSFIYYEKVLGSQIFWDSLSISIKVSAITSFLSLLIGTFMARIIFRHLKENWSKVFVWLPMVIPHFAAGYIAALLLGQSGWLSGLVYKIHLISDQTSFPALINDKWGIGIVLTYLWKEVPFVVLMLFPVYSKFDSRYEDVVKTLGGGPWEVFKTAEWPWLLPVLTETGIILFSFILSGFELPYLLGAAYPKMISVLSYQWFYEGDWSKRPQAMALMVITTIVIYFVAYFSIRLSQTRRYRMMRGR